MLRSATRSFNQSFLCSPGLSSFFARNIPQSIPKGRKGEAVLRKPELSDFSRSQDVQNYIEFIRELKSAKEGAPDLISSAIGRDAKPSAPIFNPNKKKVNKYIKSGLMKGTDSAAGRLMEEMEQEFLDQSQHKITENIKNFYDWEALRKELYIRKEKKRLLFQEERNISNYLNEDMGPKQKENQFIVQNLEKARSRMVQLIPESPETKTRPVPEYIGYKNNKNALVNLRIDGLLKTGKNSPNEKLAVLIESGILDKSKNIREVMTQSAKLIQKSQQQSIEASEAPELIEPSYIEESEGALQRGGEASEMVSSDQKTWLVARMVNGMDFELNEQEVRSGINFNKIVEYFSIFLNEIKDPGLSSLMDQLEILESLRQYEENLIQKHIASTPSLRSKGKITPEKLTEDELVSFIKHQNYDYSELLALADAYPAIFFENPRIACQLFTKLVFEFENRQRLYKKYLMLDLFIIKSKAYGKLLHSILQALPNKMNFNETSLFLWNLGKLHAKEEGKLHPRLFEKLKTTIKARIDFFLTLEANQELVSQGFVGNLSLCASGLAELNWISTEDTVTQKILSQMSLIKEEQFEHTTNLHRFTSFTTALLAQPTPLLPMFCPVRQAAALVTKSLLEAYSNAFLDFLFIEEWRNILKGAFAIKRYFEESDQLWEQSPFFKKILASVTPRVTGPVLGQLRSHDVGESLTLFQDLQVYSEPLFLPMRSQINSIMIKYDERFQMDGLPLASSAIAFFEMVKQYKSLLVYFDGNSSKLQDVSVKMKELSRLRIIFKLSPFRAHSSHYKTFEKLFELCLGADKKKKVPKSFLILLNSLSLVNFRKFNETSYDFFRNIYEQYVAAPNNLDMSVVTHIIQAASCNGFRKHIRDFERKLWSCNSVSLLTLEGAVDCLVIFAVDPPKRGIPVYFLEKLMGLLEQRAGELKPSAIIQGVWSLVVLMSTKAMRDSLIALGAKKTFKSLIHQLEQKNLSALNYLDVYLVNFLLISDVFQPETNKKLVEMVGGTERLLIDTRKALNLLRHESERLEIDSGEFTTEQMVAELGRTSYKGKFVSSKILKTASGGYIFPDLFFPNEKMAILMSFRQVSERRQEFSVDGQKDLARVIFEGGIERILRRSLRKSGIRAVVGHKEIIDREGGIEEFVRKQIETEANNPK